MNREQASGGGADEQRGEDACKPPPLFCCRGPVGEVARKEYDGCGRSSRKHTVHMKPSNCGALRSEARTPVSRRLSFAVAGQLARSPARNMMVAVAAVVNTPST